MALRKQQEDHIKYVEKIYENDVFGTNYKLENNTEKEQKMFKTKHLKNQQRMFYNIDKMRVKYKQNEKYTRHKLISVGH